MTVSPASLLDLLGEAQPLFLVLFEARRTVGVVEAMEGAMERLGATSGRRMLECEDDLES